MKQLTKESKNITKESENITISKEFKPTPAMIVWIDTAIQLMTDNITEIETKSNITAQTWYTWKKNPQFIQWFNEEWNKRISGEAWKLDTYGYKNAKKDHRYWQDMMRVTGKLNDNRSDSVAIQVNNVINDKKDTYGI